MNNLILGLGNDLIADDAVGILCARALQPLMQGRAEVVECGESGIRLLEYLIDYDRAVLIDAIYTGKHTPGAVIELHPADLSSVAAPSPHYAGLPEVFALAQELQLKIPQELIILAIEVEDPFTIGGAVTPAVQNAIPVVVERVELILTSWFGDTLHA